MISISNKIYKTIILLSCTVSLVTLSGIYKKVKEVRLLTDNLETNFISKKVSGLNLEDAYQYLRNYPKTCIEDFENLTLQNENIDIVYTQYDTFLTTQKKKVLNIYNLSESRLHKVDVTKNWKEHRVDFAIDNFFWLDLKHQNLPANMIKEVESILVNFIDIYNIKHHGNLSVTYMIQDVNIANNCIVKQLHYKSRYHDINISHIGTDLFGTYVSDGKYLVRSYTNKAPVKDGLLTSYYDKNRLHPITKEVKGHYGTDYGGQEGDPIYAVATGIIEERRKKSGNGNYIKIDHGNKIKSQYLHMSRFRDGIKEGDKVMKNQLIGYVGQTGLASAPHVCYRFWYRGRQINHMGFKDFQKTTI